MIMNPIMRYEILEKDFTTVCQYLRNGQVHLLEQETLDMLADHLEGKLKRKSGRRVDIYALERNKRAWEYHRTLMQQNNSYYDAITIMATEYHEEDPGKYRDVIRGWIEAHAKARKED